MLYGGSQFYYKGCKPETAKGRRTYSRVREGPPRNASVSSTRQSGWLTLRARQCDDTQRTASQGSSPRLQGARFYWVFVTQARLIESVAMTTPSPGPPKDKEDTPVTWDMQVFRDCLSGTADKHTGQGKKHHGRHLLVPNPTAVCKADRSLPGTVTRPSLLGRAQCVQGSEMTDFGSAVCFLHVAPLLRVPRLKLYPHTDSFTSRALMSVSERTLPCAPDSPTQLPTGHSSCLVSESPRKLTPFPAPPSNPFLLQGSYPDHGTTFHPTAQARRVSVVLLPLYPTGTSHLLNPAPDICLQCVSTSFTLSLGVALHTRPQPLI